MSEKQQGNYINAQQSFTIHAIHTAVTIVQVTIHLTRICHQVTQMMPCRRTGAVCVSVANL